MSDASVLWCTPFIFKHLFIPRQKRRDIELVMSFRQQTQLDLRGTQQQTQLDPRGTQQQTQLDLRRASAGQERDTASNTYR